MSYALLIDGRVVAAPVVGDAVWAAGVGAVELPAGVPIVPGWTLDGDPSDPESWSPPSDARDLGETRASALDQVDEVHLQRLAAGAPLGPLWPGVRASITASSRVDWLGALILAQAQLLPLPHQVELLDSATITLASVEEITLAMGGLLGAYLAATNARTAARASILAATTPAEVDVALAAYLEVS